MALEIQTINIEKVKRAAKINDVLLRLNDDLFECATGHKCPRKGTGRICKAQKERVADETQG